MKSGAAVEKVQNWERWYAIFIGIGLIALCIALGIDDQRRAEKNTSQTVSSQILADK